MVKERPDANPREKKANSSSDQTDDFGDDWEAAFQEDDYAFAGEDASKDIAIEENTGHDSTPLPPELEDIAVSETPSPQTEEIAPQSKTSASGGAAVPSRLRIFSLLFPKSNKQRICLAVFLLLAGAAGIFFWRAERPGPEIKEAEVVPMPPALPEIGPPEAGLAPVVETPESSVAVEAPAPVASAPEVAEPVEKDRKKWFFPSFLVPVAENDHSPLTFFQIDITLIVPVEKGERLPEEKRPFVRDIIFQFFSNRPLDELRRYSLSRGEMNRKLKAWMDKEWPGNPISIIVINRYQAG